MSNNFREIDRGWNRFVREYNRADGAYTKVGFPEKGNFKGEPDNDASTISEQAQIAIYQEFGTRHIHARPFIRSTMDEEKEEIGRLTDVVISGALSGNHDIKKGLGKLGEFAVAKIRNKITDIKEPGLADSTKRQRRGSGEAANPLVDTGQMRQNVQHVEVV